MDNNISVQLGSHFENFISSEIATGKYDSPSEVIIAGLRLLELEEFKKKEIVNELELGEQSSMSENFSTENHLQSLLKKQIPPKG